MPEILKKIKKNSSEEVWITITDYKGRDLIDMRVYYRTVDDMDMKPTKRGVSLSLARSADLLAAIEKINDGTTLGEPIVSIEKNDAEVVHVMLKEFKGHKLIDIRTYFRPQTSEDLIPSQKGVTFRYDAQGKMVEEIKDALTTAVEKSKKS